MLVKLSRFVRSLFVSFVFVVNKSLPAEAIMDLLNLCLTSTYFQYNGKHFKQLHGTAMGSHVSVVVVEIVMRHVGEHALATCRQMMPIKTKLTLFMTTLTNRTPKFSLLKKWKKMENFIF